VLSHCARCFELRHVILWEAMYWAAHCANVIRFASSNFFSARHWRRWSIGSMSSINKRRASVACARASESVTVGNCPSPKAIWLDVDVKAAPKGYPTLGDAIKAIGEFVKATNLPWPNALVASGGGLHVYWISNRPMPVEEWQPYAEGLKLLAMDHNLRCDYTTESTDAMYDRKDRERHEKGLGWPSCASIEGEGCKFCATCPHKGQIKSPLNLATQRTTPGKYSDSKVAASNAVVEWPDGHKSGKPVKGYANTLAAFRKLGVKFTYDVFRQKEFISGHKMQMLNGELSDRAVTMLRDQTQREFGFFPNKEVARDAIAAECTHNQINPVADYFNGLKWDGVSRLDKMLHRYLGAEDTPLNAATRSIAHSGTAHSRDMPILSSALCRLLA
jgi:hypothetical protein